MRRDDGLASPESSDPSEGKIARHGQGEPRCGNCGGIHFGSPSCPYTFEEGAAFLSFAECPGIAHVERTPFDESATSGEAKP